MKLKLNQRHEHCSPMFLYITNIYKYYTKKSEAFQGYKMKGWFFIMNEKVKDLLQQQVNKELYSAYLYLDMSNFYTSSSLDGFAHWFKLQAQEEFDHAMLITQYLQNSDIDVVLGAIDAPDASYDNFKTPLTMALEHEKYVTSLINDIYSEALANKDYRTGQFLDWFIAEQAEEEATAQDLIARFELFGDDSKGLYMLDKELGARVYETPSLEL